ncbi:hypothetical protein CJ030_MR2G004929 [Morella rubra]|uniref:DUF7086 domain-containing protein n=1 Tax=Morella rubra TaxID=262757 RepID=A0A6A1WBE8_9ROSI|nr:hypothetical protein CJ030_MR2G004929 [Morella rubra]
MSSTQKSVIMSEDREHNGKRNNSDNNNNQLASKFQELDDGEDDLPLTLSLSIRPTRPRLGLRIDEPLEEPVPPPPPLVLSPLAQSISGQELWSQIPPQLPMPISPSQPLYVPSPTYVPDSSTQTSMAYRQEGGPYRPPRYRRRLLTPVLGEGKSKAILPPFPWAMSYRANVHSLTYLRSMQILTIAGEVQCKRCEQQYEMEFDLQKKFLEVGSFIVDNISTMNDRAPTIWMSPVFPKCQLCGQENSAKPIMSVKKKAINWLFLLLGQMLGCCTLKQLKYFCKHNSNHRTGAKDRLLYQTYMELCRQLRPDEVPFDR